MARGSRVPVNVVAVVAAGGALGTLARYLISVGLPTEPGRFPWATFLTNLSGTLLLGFVLTLVVERFPPTRYVRPFLATGFCGAYTTFSTFAVESDLLVRDGHTALAVAYLAASTAGGLIAVMAGILAGRLLPAVEGWAGPSRRPGTGP
jgi:fluoride exporter